MMDITPEEIYWCYFTGFGWAGPLVMVVGVFIALKNALFASADFSEND